MLGACFALNLFGRGMGDTYTVFLLPLENELGWTRSEVSSVYSVYLLVNGCVAPLVGLVFDRLGPRWVYGAGFAALGSAFFLASGLQSLWQFYASIGVLVGFGVSMNGMVASSALLSRWYRERLSTAIGIAYSAIGLGTLLFVPVAQALVDAFGWRAAYRILGVALLVLVPLVVLLFPWPAFAAGDVRYRLPAQKRAGEGWTLRAAMASPMFWALAGVFFFTATSMFSVVVQLVAFLIGVGFSPLAAASAFGLLGLMSGFSVMSSGYVSDRFGYRQTVSVSYAGTACGMAVLFAMTFAPSALLLALFVAVFGVCMGTRGPIVSSISARFFAGRHVATIYGLIYGANAVGAAFGAYLGGLLHDLTGGYRVGLFVAVSVLGLAVAPFWTVPVLKEFR